MSQISAKVKAQRSKEKAKKSSGYHSTFPQSVLTLRARHSLGEKRVSTSGSGALAKGPAHGEAEPSTECRSFAWGCHIYLEGRIEGSMPKSIVKNNGDLGG